MKSRRMQSNASFFSAEVIVPTQLYRFHTRVLAGSAVLTFFKVRSRMCTAFSAPQQCVSSTSVHWRMRCTGQHRYLQCVGCLCVPARPLHLVCGLASSCVVAVEGFQPPGAVARTPMLSSSHSLYRRTRGKVTALTANCAGFVSIARYTEWPSAHSEPAQYPRKNGAKPHLPLHSSRWSPCLRSHPEHPHLL